MNFPDPQEARREHDDLCWLLLRRWPLPEPRPSVEKVRRVTVGILTKPTGRVHKGDIYRGSKYQWRQKMNTAFFSPDSPGGGLKNKTITYLFWK